MKLLLIILLSCTWELLQSIIAMYVLLVNCKNIKEVQRYNLSIVFILKKGSIYGLSLGRFIFIHEKKINNDDTKKHEYGHGLQSLMLWIFYLFIIGIPSLCNQNIRNEKIYFSKYPENWADKLGNVKRKY